MRMPSRLAKTTLAGVTLAAVLAGTSAGRPAAHAADPSTDKLAQVLARGTLLAQTDPAYPPQSYKVANAKRPAKTRCAANQLTASQMAGYDADVTKAVAAALGVEPCFVTPTWSEVISGHWDDRWDVAFGSGAITADRMQRLWMTQPYYAVPQKFYVAKSSRFKTVSDLNGRTIGACSGCSQLLYLHGLLHVPGEAITLAVKRPKIRVYDVEPPGLKALGNGVIDAFLCSETVGQGAIRDGVKLRPLGRPAFFEYEAGFVDKSSNFTVGPFVKKLNSVIRGLQASGAFRRLSVKYFGKDYATQAAQFNLASLKQNVPGA